MDGITGREDQERDEEFTSPDVGYPSRSDIEMVAWATGGGFLSHDVDFEVDDEDESYSCGRPGCPGHVDPPPHTTCIAAIGRDQLTAVVLSVADIERIKEAAYRAGREDALRWAADQIDPGSREVSVARRVDRGMVFVVDADRGTATKLRLWADQQARGVGVQPIEEQRARDEDQKRDEEAEHG